MAGSLTIPNVLAAEAGPTVAVSKADANWNQIRDYVNNREVSEDTLANRPAASISGRLFFATDTAQLFRDTGAAWTLLASAARYLSDLTGLGLANNAGDATNDIDVAVGACASDDATIANRVLMSLTSGLTKQLDAAWAAGTNQGGRMSAAGIANTTYHVFLIMRTDTGNVDMGFDTSPTAPSLPTNYTKARRIGSIVRAGGTILGFVQDRDYFRLKTSVLDVNTPNPGTNAVTATLASVPTGVTVFAIVNAERFPGSSGGMLHLSDLAANDEAPSTTVAPLAMQQTDSGTSALFVHALIRTNTSAQIRYRTSSSAGAGDVVRIVTLGWVDPRGRG